MSQYIRGVRERLCGTLEDWVTLKGEIIAHDEGILIWTAKNNRRLCRGQYTPTTYSRNKLTRQYISDVYLLLDVSR